MNILRIKQIILLVAFILMTAMETFACKAMPGYMQVTLQDGRMVTVSLRGDEHMNFLLSSDGEIIMEEDGIYRIATPEEVEDIKKTCEKLKEENYAAQAKVAGSLRTNSGEGITGNRLFPHKGKQKVLVLMAEFADVKFTYGQHEIDSLLNSTATSRRIASKTKSYTTGEERIIRRNSNIQSYSSVAKYFMDCSDGQFEPEFDVYGPYTLPSNMKVYGAGFNDRMDLFIPAVCALADNDVNFSEYDADGDGYVDLVYIIYAGYSANWTQNGSDCIWPKSGPSSDTGTTYGTYDGKTVYRYGVNGELLAYEGVKDSSTGLPYLNGIGVFCHEFSHTMGLPDFYPASTSNSSQFDSWVISDFDNQSMEDWDLMDNGENSVNGCWLPLYTAFERELMGWMKLDTLSSPADVTMKPLMHGGTAYRILNDNDPTGNEYWILEAISTDEISEGWHQYMPGKGLLITHVNYSPSSFSIKNNNVNATKGKPGITIIPADGYLASTYRYSATGSDAMTYEEILIQESGDPYPGSKGITEFNNYKAYTGTVDKPITNIVQNADFSVSFTFMGGECYDVTLTADPQEGGTVEGGGTYHVDSVATLKATPAEGYTFLGWSDGVADTLRYLTVLGDTVLTAQFKKAIIGDANNDGSVTMADANLVVNYFLSEDKSTININLTNADVNNDGDITMADANAIVNIFLGTGQ